MLQLIFHLLGDYVFQSDWMANEKTKNSWACLMHVFTYSAGFLILKPSALAFVVIAGTHFLIDRYRLAKYVCYSKNFLAPSSVVFLKNESEVLPFEPDLFVDKYRWENCKATGYPSETPPFLAF